MNKKKFLEKRKERIEKQFEVFERE